VSIDILDQQELRRAFGSFPTGVVAVAALGPNGPIGLAASSFTSVSLDPPIVSVNIARTSTTLPGLRKQQYWGVSVLAEGQDRLGRQLSSKSTDRFAGVEWRATESGAVLLEGAAAQFTVRVDTFVTAGDHDIALLAVEGLTFDGSTSPLVFHASRFRQLGVPPVVR
jgi:flavin reductase (DIM6/NTAB) family NADH-FMN oxidoreductase RutF